MAALLLLAGMVVVWSAPALAIGGLQFDAVEVHYSAQRFVSDALHHGSLPFWTGDVFSGFPLLADIQTGAWYPLNWPFFLLGVTPRSITGELLLHTLIACGGAYALGLRLFSRPAAALATAIFYGLSGYFATHSQHVGIVQTAAWLPTLVLLLDVVAERLSPARLAGLGLLGAAIMLPGHFQTALYATTGAAIWALLEAAAQRSVGRAWRTALGLLALGGLGALLSMVMLLPGLELTAQSVRATFDPRTVDVGYFHPGSLLTLIQPDHYGLLSGHYIGPGDSTQHEFYAGSLLVPLALVGLSDARARRMALLLGLPFLVYALGPSGGLYQLALQLPGFSRIELPMHGWFLPGLGLAVLGGAGFSKLPGWKHLVPALLLVMFADVFVCNQLLNPLAYARQSFDEQYGPMLGAFQAELATAQPPMERVVGDALAAVGYRNHGLQSQVETTYGDNPLELAGYAAHQDAAERNPRLWAALAATHSLLLAADGQPRLEPLAGGLPLAYFARSIRFVGAGADPQAALADLDPRAATLVTDASLRSSATDPLATATIVQRQPDQLLVHVQAPSGGLLRVAIPSYPGWHASLHGTQLPIVTADVAFLGVVVPPGEGDVSIWYTPRWFWPGLMLSGLGLVVTLALLLSGARAADASRDRPTPPPAPRSLSQGAGGVSA